MSRETLRFDVVVVGSGISGCAAALAAAQDGASVALLSKEGDVGETNTRYAQGGIIYTSPDDSPELLVSDIMSAGAEAGDPEAAAIIAGEGPGMVESVLLRSLGVPFDRDRSGRLKLTREAAHSAARIIHRKDTTGEAIQTELLRGVRAEPLITVFPATTATALLMADDRCAGVRASDPGNPGGELRLTGRGVVLATGGYAGLYERTTNPEGATGDGLALALAAGCSTRDLHYVQFHPTVLYEPGLTGRAALVSEAVRGEGGVLVNRRGDEFIEHSLGSLAPRDIVARSAYAEMSASGEPCVYLAATPARTGRKAGWFAERFPQIHARCMSAGFDPDRVPVPVSPAAHYTCGGVVTDTGGRTSVPGLLAAGEVASTGLHGANRLASTSLLEGLVFGWRAGLSAMGGDPPIRITAEVGPDAAFRAGRNLRKNLRSRVEEILWERCGIVRDARNLEAGLAELAELASDASEVTVARAVMEDALSDDTSLGCHLRSDATERLAGVGLAALPG